MGPGPAPVCLLSCNGLPGHLQVTSTMPSPQRSARHAAQPMHGTAPRPEHPALHCPAAGLPQWCSVTPHVDPLLCGVTAVGEYLL